MVVLVKNDRSLVVDASNVAMPVGTTFPTQFKPASKSNVPKTGPATVATLFQVAFCAAAGSVVNADSAVPASSARIRRARLLAPRPPTPIARISKLPPVRFAELIPAYIADTGQHTRRPSCERRRRAKFAAQSDTLATATLGDPWRCSAGPRPSPVV